MKKTSLPILIELPRSPDHAEERRQLVRKALFQDLNDSGHAVERAVWAWRQLACHLIPLIGEPGFSALFGRSLRLTIPAHKIFFPTQAGQTSVSLLAALKENLNAVEEAIAIDGVVTLMDTFAGLLSGLIGEPLTVKVMKSALVGEPGSTNTEEASK